MKDTRYVITLVHGTWARKASWIRPHSKLSEALRERLGQDAKIFRLIWTGHNSPNARSVASERLKKKLALRLKDHPTARHYIVCHSHGGNIALSAVAGNELERNIDGIVCLATPFLLARERDFGMPPAAILGPGIVVGILLLMLGIGAVWPGIWGAPTDVLWLVMLALFFFAILLTRQWLRFAYKLRKELTPPRIGDTSRILIVRSPSDEASGALVLSQFLSWITVRIYLLLESLFSQFKTAVTRFIERRWMVIAVVVAALATFFGTYVALRSAALAGWLGTVAMTGLAVSTAIVLLAPIILFSPSYGVYITTIGLRLMISIIVWPMIFLLSVLLLPFGWRIALANVLLDVTAETTPVGSSWIVHLVLPPTSREPEEGTPPLKKDTPPLMHSIIYENPSVLKIVCDWIAKGREAQTSGGAIQTPHTI